MKISKKVASKVTASTDSNVYSKAVDQLKQVIDTLSKIDDNKSKQAVADLSVILFELQ